MTEKLRIMAGILLLFTGAALGAQTAAETVPFQSDRWFSEAGGWSEPLDTGRLIELFLKSSGTDPSRIPAYEKRIGDLLEEIDLAAASRPAESAEGEFLLDYMHDHLLTRYELTQTRLDTLLENGRYNCVSSGILYLILARHRNVAAWGIQAEDHAFCAVRTEDGTAVDVETTTEWGYDPGTRKDFHSAFTDRTGYVYVPPGEYDDRLRLGDRDMAGLILQNRIVELQKQRKYHEALELAADRLALTGSARAEQDYFDSVQNAAAWMNSRHRYADGIDYINRAAGGFPDLPEFLRETRSQLVYNQCGSLMNSGRTAEASEFLETHRSFLSESMARELERLIAARELESLLAGGYSEETLRRIESAMEDGLLTERRASEMAVYLYAREAETLSGGVDFLKGMLFLETAPGWLAGNREYQKILNVFRQNYGITVHNELVPLMNSREWDRAEERLLEGLRHIPDSVLLKQDLEKIRELRNR